MTRVLMFGYGALPIEGLRVTGPSLRTWHFLRVLLDAGHEVCLIGDRTHGTYPDDLPEIISQRKDRWTYHSVSDMAWHNPKALKPLVKDFQADCAIGVTTSATAIATEVIGDLPLWGDLYGSIMAEAQLKALVYGDDLHLRHFWEIERKAIERADIFSAVSDRQRWSLIGELGMWGRLNQWTSWYEFATTIPIASETTPYSMSRRIVRGVMCDPKAFIILYSGGYNTWTDVDTLFAALEKIMSQRPEVVFVSTGGRIEGHDDITYTRFARMIESSPYCDRFKLCGWVPTPDVPGFYLESNVGVNVDRPSYEAMLGSRTRVLDWMRAGLPSILSPLTELSEYVAKAGAGLLYQPGDPVDLARCLESCATDPAAAAVMGQKGRELLLEHFTYEATAVPLCAWVQKPTHAPDYGANVPRLVQGYRARTLSESFQRGGIDLSVALKVWKILIRIPGVSLIQRPLMKLGFRSLRLNRPPFQADYRAYDIMTQMHAGVTVQAAVKIANRGVTAWQPDSVTLSYHWYSAAKTMIEKNGLRSKLPTSVARGATVELVMSIAAPTTPGRYLLELDMVREGITWFSESGSPGPMIAVDVI